MATVQKKISPAKSRHKYEMGFDLRQREDGKPSYTFKLHGNDVEVLASGQSPAGPEWYDDLSATEKLQVFNAILAEYRSRSMGANNMKIAALGVTEQGRIYVSENSEQLSDDYNRQCAEQTMVTVSSIREVYRQTSEHEESPEKLRKPEYPHYKTVYLMGGKDDGKPSIVCPCGNCTDMLAKIMPPDANVWMLPVAQPMKNNEISREVPPINYGAANTDELKPGEVMCTTIGYLNRERSVPLKTEDMQMQKDAYDDLSHEMSTLLTEERAGKKIQGHSVGMVFEREFEYLKKAAAKAMDPAKVNKLQVLQVKMGVYDQLRALIRRYDLKDLSPKGIKDIIHDHIYAVRCVAFQLDNGKVFSTAHVKSSINSALPPAEVSALGGDANLYLGTSGVVKAQILEFNEASINNGEIPASQKAAIERLVKYRSKVNQTVELGYMPYNKGNLPAKAIEHKLKTYDAKEIYPGFFIGKGDTHVYTDIEQLNVHRGAGVA